MTDSERILEILKAGGEFGNQYPLRRKVIMTKFLIILATAASVATAVFSFSETRTTRRAQVEAAGTVWTWIEYQTQAGDYTETSIETERFQEFPHVDQVVIYDTQTGEVVQ